MSNNKKKNGADMIYDQHLAGTSMHGFFRGKPNDDRQPMFERMYLRILSELSVNRFKWIGLPEEIDPRFLELSLFRTAFALIYKDERFGKFMNVRAVRKGQINAYDNPTAFNTTAINFPNISLNAFSDTFIEVSGEPVKIAGPGIPVWANYLRIPDMDIVQVYAGRFAVLDRTLEINSENARQNKVAIGSQQMRMTHNNIAREVAMGNNYLEVGGPIQDLEFLQTIDLSIDGNLIENLTILRAKWWSECMGLLGIDNANQDKKERLVTAEVGANDDQTGLMRNVNLNARQEACNRINAAYGLDVWVEYNTEVDKLVTIPDFAEDGLESAGYTVTEPDESASVEDARFNDFKEGAS